MQILNARYINNIPVIADLPVTNLERLFSNTPSGRWGKNNMGTNGE